MRIFFLPISKTLSKDKHSPNSYFFGAIKKQKMVKGYIMEILWNGGRGITIMTI